MRIPILFGLVACATSTPQPMPPAVARAEPAVPAVEFTNQMIPSDLIWTGERLVFAADRSLLHPTAHGPMMIVLRSYTAGGRLIRERSVIDGMRAKLAYSGTGYGMAYTTQDAGGGDLHVNFARLDRDGEVVDTVALGDAPQARIAWNATRREFAVGWAHVDRTGSSAIEVARFSERGERLGQATIATAKPGVFAYGFVSGLAAVGDHYVMIAQTPLTAITTDGTRLSGEQVIADGREGAASLLADRDGALVTYREDFALRVARITGKGVTRATPLQTAAYGVGDPLAIGTVAAPWLLYGTRTRENWRHLGANAVPLTADLAFGAPVAVEDSAIVDWNAVVTPVPGGLAVGYQVGHFQLPQDVRVEVIATPAIAR